MLRQVAVEYNLDTDQVHQREWEAFPVSETSINTVLPKARSFVFLPSRVLFALDRSALCQTRRAVTRAVWHCCVLLPLMSRGNSAGERNPARHETRDRLVPHADAAARAVQIANVEWVLDECSSRWPDTKAAAKLLADYALKRCREARADASQLDEAARAAGLEEKETMLAARVKRLAVLERLDASDYIDPGRCASQR